MSPIPVDSPELVKKLQDGEREAWNGIARHWECLVLAVIRFNGRGSLQPADIEDAFQNTFLRAYKNCNRIDANTYGVVLPWLLKIARGCAIDLVRRKRPVAGLAADDVLSGNSPQAAAVDANHGPDQIAMSDELVEVIGRCMDELPAGDCDILRRRENNECPLSQTAEEMGVSPAAAKSQLGRARKRLRELLDAVGVFLS